MFSEDTSSAISGFQAKLELKENATPVFLKPYPIPHALLKSFDDIIDMFLQQRKIEPVNQSEWASPCMLVATKTGDFRLVVDFQKTVNVQCKTFLHPPLKPNDIFAKFSGAKCFCLIDLADAITQVELDSSSQELVVFNTPHRGLFKC